MAEITEITVYDGYRMLRSEERIPLSEAGCLGTKKQRRYTSVRREGEELVLEKHRLRCPGCGCGTPAYSRYLGGWRYKLAPRVPRNVVRDWLEHQFSLFGEEGERLELNKPVTSPEEFRCPRCGFLSTPARERLQITVIREGEKALLRCGPVNMGQLLDRMPERGGCPVRLRFPLEETVEFDIGKSRVIYRITDGGGGDVFVRELTGEGKEGLQPVVFSRLGENRIVKRKFAHAFSRAYGETLPFSFQELMPGAFLGMTCFSHFPREFYDAIPYDLYGHGVEESFQAAAGELSDIARLPELYAASSLPGSKSVRRAFFTDAGLFFYLPEAEALAGVFSDVNYFCRFLALEQVYDVLSCVHMYPGTLAFFRDYAGCRGQGILLRELKEKHRILETYARSYCAMTPGGQAAERKKWKGKSLSPEPGQRHSVPMGRGAEVFPGEQTVGRYTFARLRNKRAFLEAAKALNNCLGEWDGSKNPVIAVKLEGRYQAAIEVEGRQIVQQLAADNEPICEDPELFAAVEKWKERNRFTDSEMLSYLEEGALPF